MSSASRIYLSRARARLVHARTRVGAAEDRKEYAKDRARRGLARALLRVKTQRKHCTTISIKTKKRTPKARFNDAMGVTIRALKGKLVTAARRIVTVIRHLTATLLNFLATLFARRAATIKPLKKTCKSLLKNRSLRI